MFETLFGIIAILGAAVTWLFKRNGSLKQKVLTEKQKRHTAEQRAEHAEQTSDILVSRNNIQAQVIKEKVDDATENNFGDFYDSDGE